MPSPSRLYTIAELKAIEKLREAYLAKSHRAKAA